MKNNTELHADNPYLLKLDFKNFFPSIKGEDFIKYAKFSNNLGLPDQDLHRLMKILFWLPKSIQTLQLSIGAPSSPQLSNALLYGFDVEIAKFCSQNGVSYTRYADDMTFSMKVKEMRGSIRHKVLEILYRLPFPRLEINEHKTVYGSKAHRRMVTGLILANDGCISLGREKKRRLRAKIHHFLKGNLSEKEREKLRGYLAFSKSVEPDFIKRMERKYGDDLIGKI